MVLLSNLKRYLVETLYYCDFIDYYVEKFSCDTTVKNSLDYLKLKVMKYTQLLG